MQKSTKSAGRSRKPRAYKPRVGDVMIASASHLALHGPSYPTEVARALDGHDGSAWKAFVRLGELGMIEELDEVDGPRRYRLTRHGWNELERVLIPRRGWDLAHAEARAQAFEEELAARSAASPA